MLGSNSSPLYELAAIVGSEFDSDAIPQKTLIQGYTFGDDKCHVYVGHFSRLQGNRTYDITCPFGVLTGITLNAVQNATNPFLFRQFASPTEIVFVGYRVRVPLLQKDVAVETPPVVDFPPVGGGSDL